jgi:hypothetical protein
MESTLTEFFSIGLPKWPALVVKGERVTEEQASEICIRTNRQYFGCNSPKLTKELHEIFYNLPPTNNQFVHSIYDYFDDSDKDKWNKAQKIQDRTKRELGLLDLEYLSNSQIVSSYVGGPHGWCNWNGYIGCDTYNIGKWPSTEDVYNEWKTIAEAFPYLNLKCQLFSGEQCDENVRPLIQYNIINGTVNMEIPTSVLDYPNTSISPNMMASLLGDPYLRESGISINDLKEKVRKLKEKRK